MRNVTVITQAPTGSTGTMVGTSTGIEPYFAFEYFRQSRLGFDKQYVPIAQAYKDTHPDEELPDYFVTSMSLSAEDHVRVQAAIQTWVDSSISKTANAPHDFTVEQTKNLYELAFDLGCKGVTIYRDGSRDVQVLSTTDSKDESKEDSKDDKKEIAQASAGHTDFSSQLSQDLESKAEQVIDRQYKRRPQILRGSTYKMNTPFGMAYITINDMDGSPSEVFLNVGKAGSDVFAMAEALGRVCSLFLRYGDHGDKVRLLVKHLKGIGGSGAIGFGSNRVESIADAVAKALEQHVELIHDRHEVEDYTSATSEMVEAPVTPPVSTSASPTVAQPIASSPAHSHAHGVSLKSKDLCTSCGSASLVSGEGCKTCMNCGYSRCS